MSLKIRPEDYPFLFRVVVANSRVARGFPNSTGYYDLERGGGGRSVDHILISVARSSDGGAIPLEVFKVNDAWVGRLAYDSIFHSGMTALGYYSLRNDIQCGLLSEWIKLSVKQGRPLMLVVCEAASYGGIGLVWTETPGDLIAALIGGGAEFSIVEKPR